MGSALLASARATCLEYFLQRIARENIPRIMIGGMLIGVSEGRRVGCRTGLI